MKKRIVFGIIACAILAAGIFAVANSNVSIIINGNELITDNVKNENGSVIAPVRAVAEALDAKVAWDAASQSVIINKASDNSSEQRISLLEQALAPKDALSAVKTWAEAVKLRNGALQYALLSDELKILKKDEFSDMFWTTGTSSPWVSSYDITEKAKHAENTILYQVVFTFTDSTKNTTQEIRNVTVKNFEESYLISDIENISAIGEITEVKKDEADSITGVFIENKSNNIIGEDKANVIITKDTKIYDGYTNKFVSAESLTSGTTIEATFVDGPRIMIYPTSAAARIIRIF